MNRRDFLQLVGISAVGAIMPLPTQSNVLTQPFDLVGRYEDLQENKSEMPDAVRQFCDARGILPLGDGGYIVPDEVAKWMFKRMAGATC